MNKQSQTLRILQALTDANGEEVNGATLSRIGSGKPDGWTASLSRRISDIRAMGYNVTCRKETVNGQVHSFYTLRPKPMPQAQALAEIKSIYGNGVKVEFAHEGSRTKERLICNS